MRRGGGSRRREGENPRTCTRTLLPLSLGHGSPPSPPHRTTHPPPSPDLGLDPGRPNLRLQNTLGVPLSRPKSRATNTLGVPLRSSLTHTLDDCRRALLASDHERMYASMQGGAGDLNPRTHTHERKRRNAHT